VALPSCCSTDETAFKNSDTQFGTGPLRVLASEASELMDDDQFRRPTIASGQQSGRYTLRSSGTYRSLQGNRPHYDSLRSLKAAHKQIFSQSVDTYARYRLVHPFFFVVPFHHLYLYTAPHPAASRDFWRPRCASPFRYRTMRWSTC
jgi:hypothetical protein